LRIAERKAAPLEQAERLSRSILWNLQRKYFETRGIEAWRTDGLPHHITSNPFIADTYAKLVLGSLRDIARGHDAGSAPLDPDQPLYILELGAGHGRFGYLFLRRFLKTWRGSSLHRFPVRYVMTDFTDTNLDYLRAHPRLQSFIAEGLLDFARFDLERDEELTLCGSGLRLAPGSVRNPLTVIANYVFDSVPQDAFCMREGQLFEKLITVTSGQREPSLDNPEILSRADIAFSESPAPAGDYYPVPEWNRILQRLCERLPQTDFLFPVAALACVRNLLHLAGDRLLLLAADKGLTQDEALLRGHGEPHLVFHGSFSMMVDFRILGELFRLRGGEALHPSHRHQSLNLSAFLLAPQAGEPLETRQAYEETVERLGPDGFSALAAAVERSRALQTFDEIYAFLRWSGWDYRLFEGCLPQLKELLPRLTELQKRDLRRVIWAIWDTYFPLGETDDLAFALGTLLLEMQMCSDALELLAYSASLYGMEPGTAYNMALCHRALHRLDAALEHVDQAYELDPRSDAIRALRIEILASLEAGAPSRPLRDGED
jgi:tetratricopeptide (TPR) repeat protein